MDDKKKAERLTAIKERQDEIKQRDQFLTALRESIHDKAARQLREACAPMLKEYLGEEAPGVLVYIPEDCDSLELNSIRLGYLSFRVTGKGPKLIPTVIHIEGIRPDGTVSRDFYDFDKGRGMFFQLAADLMNGAARGGELARILDKAERGYCKASDEIADGIDEWAMLDIERADIEGGEPYDIDGQKLTAGQIETYREYMEE